MLLFFFFLTTSKKSSSKERLTMSFKPEFFEEVKEAKAGTYFAKTITKTVVALDDWHNLIFNPNSEMTAQSNRKNLEIKCPSETMQFLQRVEKEAVQTLLQAKYAPMIKKLWKLDKKSKTYEDDIRSKFFVIVRNTDNQYPESIRCKFDIKKTKCYTYQYNVDANEKTCKYHAPDKVSGNAEFFQQLDAGSTVQMNVVLGSLWLKHIGFGVTLNVDSILLDVPDPESNCPFNFPLDP